MFSFSFLRRTADRDRLRTPARLDALFPAGWSPGVGGGAVATLPTPDRAPPVAPASDAWSRAPDPDGTPAAPAASAASAASAVDVGAVGAVATADTPDRHVRAGSGARDADSDADHGAGHGVEAAKRRDKHVAGVAEAADSVGATTDGGRAGVSRGRSRGGGAGVRGPSGSPAVPRAARSRPVGGDSAAVAAAGVEPDLPSPAGRSFRPQADRPDRPDYSVGRVARWARGWWLDPGRQGALLLVGLALAAAVVVGYLAWQHHTAAETVPLTPPPVRSAVQPTPNPTARRSVVVAVAGKVRQPGIVTLPVGARVIDAIRAAGGVAPGAHAGLINLARPLADGEQVVVGLPTGGGVGCPGCSGPGGGGGLGGEGSGGASSDAVPPGTAPVNLNAATTGELDALPGVGPVTAQRIVDWRRVHGRFDTIDQLREVDGIGPAKFARLRARVIV